MHQGDDEPVERGEITLEPSRLVTHQPSEKFHDSETRRQCPYDSCHVIDAYRYQRHILRCRKQNPQKAADFRQCKYNAMHFFHMDTILEHEEECVDKGRIERRLTVGVQDQTKPVTDNISMNFDENWESKPCEGKIDGMIRPRRETILQMKKVLRAKYPNTEDDFEGPTHKLFTDSYTNSYSSFPK